MQLGFVTIPDVIVFALHFSTASGDSRRWRFPNAWPAAIHPVRSASFHSGWGLGCRRPMGVLPIACHLL